MNRTPVRSITSLVDPAFSRSTRTRLSIGADARSRSPSTTTTAVRSSNSWWSIANTGAPLRGSESSKESVIRGGVSADIIGVPQRMESAAWTPSVTPSRTHATTVHAFAQFAADLPVLTAVTGLRRHSRLLENAYLRVIADEESVSARLSLIAADLDVSAQERGLHPAEEVVHLGASEQDRVLHLCVLDR